MEVNGLKEEEAHRGVLVIMGEIYEVGALGLQGVS